MLQKTLDFNKNTPIESRKKFGQYFTPDNIKKELIDYLPITENSLILEPSVGTGEFIPFIKNHFLNPRIKAYDIDKNLVELNKNIDCEQCDFLKKSPEPIYDFIIGNPPYFEYSPDATIKDKFQDVISGRVNIYALFIRHAIDFLKEGGYLAFVVPTSMNNGKYFYKLRQFIVDNCQVEEIINFNDNEFVDAQQNVQIIILRKDINTGKNLFKWKNEIYFTKDYLKMYELSRNKVTLKELGFRVKTGSVVWNQNKEKLTDDVSKRKLIWSNNIKNGKIVEYKHDIKKQYIDTDKCDIFPAIVVNRITGVGSNLNIKSAIIDEPFLAENHVNVITPIKQESKKNIEYIFKALNSDNSKCLLKGLMGNTQVSKAELENLLIFDGSD